MSNSTTTSTLSLSSLQASDSGSDSLRQMVLGRARRLGLSESRRPDPLGFVVGDLALQPRPEGWGDHDAFAEAECRVRAWARVAGTAR